MIWLLLMLYVLSHMYDEMYVSIKNFELNWTVCIFLCFFLSILDFYEKTQSLYASAELTFNDLRPRTQ